MKCSRKPSVVSSLCWPASLILSLLFLASQAAAQQAEPGPAPPPGRADPKAASRERQGREAMLRSTELLIRPSVGRPGAEAAAEQVKEDFTHIQVLRNNIARHLTRGGPLDLKLIAREAKEVNKRANRLREHLMPQAPKDWSAESPNTPALEPDGMPDALVALCQRIDSFTENPIFKVIGVVNV
jgi:hypothetical protein